jgi:hypothetical protein
MKSSVLRQFTVSLATIIISLIAIPVLSQEEDTSGSAESEDVEMIAIPHRVGYRNRGLGFGGPNTPQQQLDDDDVIREPIYRFASHGSRRRNVLTKNMIFNIALTTICCHRALVILSAPKIALPAASCVHTALGC